MSARWSRRTAFASAALLLAACAAVVLFPSAADVPEFAAVKARWRPSEAWLQDREGRVLHELRLDYTVRRHEWTALAAISPALTTAMVEGEDRRFWHHRGVDWIALAGAARDAVAGKRRRGASTITMQVAALIDPEVRAGGSTGAWRRKLAQIRAARALESRWSKAQILEAYLNLLGFRGELQGIGAASRVLAGKEASGLGLPESLVLAALLPAPGAAPERIVTRACARAAARGLRLGCAAIRGAAEQMLRRHASGAAAGNPTDLSPRLAPQLAHMLLRTPGERLRTTLDAELQKLAIGVLREHLAALAAQNVRDGALLVVGNDGGEVLAYVGSGGPHSTASAVDGVRARRQAGSTLKPFLYALALERRHLTAASLLEDSPIALDTASGLYLPQNYDRDFKGLVSVRTALGSSLNVPAVRALTLVGVEPFRERLHALGFAGITQPGDFYGYSLALGSAEVSLWEQVQAYRVLARGGRWTPLRLMPAAQSTGDATRGVPEERRLSEEASFIVADMLADRGARALTFGLDNHLDTRFWSAVKTGTSKDMRDNWCIGFSSRYTVGVWVGNFEGDAMHDVTGVSGAAPVWQKLMMALHARLPSEAPAMPAGVVRALARYVPAVEAPREEYFLSAATPSAAITVGGGIARIASPANGMVIALDPDIPPANQRVPIAARGADEAMVLRLNGRLLGPAARQVLWRPVPGAHVLALEDARGRLLDSARFTVR